MNSIKKIFIDGGGPRRGRIFAGVFSMDLGIAIHEELEHPMPTSVVAEFMALQVALREIQKRKPGAYFIHTDNLLVEKMWEGCRLVPDHLIELRKQIFEQRSALVSDGYSIFVQWIDRRYNVVADALTHAPWPPKKKSLKIICDEYNNTWSV